MKHAQAENYRPRHLSKKRSFWALLIGVVLVVGSGTMLVWQTKASPALTQGMVRIGDQVLTVDIAKTPAQQAQGLGGRCQLADGTGMLFPYATEMQPTYWMKRMRISIDLLWIRDGEVTGIEKNMATDGGKRRYTAPEPVDYVLEVPAGWADRYAVTPGIAVEFLEES